MCCLTIAFVWRITSRIGDCLIFSSYSKQSIQWSYRDRHLVFTSGRMWVAYVLFNIQYNWIWICVFFCAGFCFAFFLNLFFAVPFFHSRNHIFRWLIARHSLKYQVVTLIVIKISKCNNTNRSYYHLYGK